MSAASRFVSQDREQDIELLARSRRQIAASRRLLAMPVLRMAPQRPDKDCSGVLP